MIRRRWKWLLVIVLLPIAIWYYDRMNTLRGQGICDLTIEFVIVDESTGNPIPEAKINISFEEKLPKEKDEPDFVLISNQAGKAEKICLDCRTAITRSGLNFTNTYVVYPPWGTYRVSAGGYTTTNLVELNPFELLHQVQQTAPGEAKLVVRVSMEKVMNPAK